jgi:hypothetical protein
MKTIYKYPIVTTDRQTLLLPKDAEILSVQIQGDSPVLYAFINTKNKTKTARVIEIFGTGNPIEEYDTIKSLKYIGTYQLQMIGFVGHVFERVYQPK